MGWYRGPGGWLVYDYTDDEPSLNENWDDGDDDDPSLIEDGSNNFPYFQENIKEDLETHQKMIVFKFLTALANATIINDYEFTS